MNEHSPPTDIDRVALRPRHVTWEWEGLPTHFLDDDPTATHTVNALNMLLPEGEVFFVSTFQTALGLITDARVRTDVLGFIGQEAMHSTSHQGVLDHFAAHGTDTSAFTDQARWLFRTLLGDRDLTGERARQWLIERVATIAALEHVTSYFGNWGLNARAWDTAMESRMRDLILWHLAEEVEHRHVAYDLYTHLHGGYFRRIRAHVAAFPTFVLLIYRGTRFMAIHDPDAPRTRLGLLRGYYRASKRGLVPKFGDWLKMSVEYFRPDYHPSRYGSTTQAVAYLASSPAAQKAILR